MHSREIFLPTNLPVSSLQGVHSAAGRCVEFAFRLNVMVCSRGRELQLDRYESQSCLLEQTSGRLCPHYAAVWDIDRFGRRGGLLTAVVTLILL